MLFYKKREKTNKWSCGKEYDNKGGRKSIVYISILVQTMYLIQACMYITYVHIYLSTWCNKFLLRRLGQRVCRQTVASHYICNTPFSNLTIFLSFRIFFLTFTSANIPLLFFPAHRVIIILILNLIYKRCHRLLKTRITISMKATLYKLDGQKDEH